MGNQESSPLATDNNTAMGGDFPTKAKGAGRESNITAATAELSTTSLLSGDFEPSTAFGVTHEAPIAEEEILETDSESSDEEEEDREFEEALMERRRVLEDAANLKKLANYFQHPEAPIQSEGAARCYFDRISAVQRLSAEEANERAVMMQELQALKQQATYFMHPERPVVTSDPTVYGRNYFTRASAPPTESLEEAEERATILQELQALQQSAKDFMHPERAVSTTDPCACGRNYFERASAPERESPEDAAERAMVLAEAKALKQTAVDFMHPEVPMFTTDPTACGRNYFSRPSAPSQEDVEEAEERARVIAEAKALKQQATDYMHPEMPVVTTDAFACGRNYFSRPSAPSQEDAEEAEERARVLAEAQELKKVATDFMHPEKPVVTTDAFACGRNYFSRPSAPVMDAEEEEERARILADCATLKGKAIDFMHPEKPVATDAFACGRNYFSRYSAPHMNSKEEEERARILEECAALKNKAVDFMHPEKPVATDAFACGRNYFSRYSAPEQEDLEEAEERARVMAECAALKQTAVDYKHPELPVATDAFACGRNYFSRYSAPEQEDLEEAEERARVMAECAALKQKAVDFMHPEKPIVTSDPFACGRNYFSRYSAPEQEEHELDEEHERILEELKQLKQLAVNFKHPELHVVTTDPLACARNYFSRYSAPEQEDPEEAEERARILADCQALKEKAIDFNHPELPVVTTDAFACARNYFLRPSALEQMDKEDADERALVLAEAKLFKQFAMHYKHPELPAISTDAHAIGRNFYSRYNAAGHDHMIHTFPSHEHDEHHEEHHEHFEHWGMDEDVLFDEMRHTMVVPTQGKVAAGGEEEEGNLSRSPSSVMLHIGESIYD